LGYLPKEIDGYNLAIAHAFAQTFDGFRAKFGDVHLEVIEESVAQETRLP
jgi:hypothetical protein